MRHLFGYGLANKESGRLIFVCTGNYYRSRLAELLFNHYAALAGLGWRAESRGLVVTGRLRGIAPEARDYAESHGLPDVPDRNPLPLLVDELAAAGLVVLMNRAEHEPLMERDFRPILRLLVSRDAVRAWNVFDLPVPRAGWGAEPVPSQPGVSSTEHIHFAVRTLLSELQTS